VVWADGRVEGEIEIFVAEPDITVTARAMEINRIDLVEHARVAVVPAEVLARLLGFVADHFRSDLAAGEQVVLVGHNVGFDIGFLRRLCRLAGAPFPNFFSHRSLDTASVLRFLSLAGIVPPSAVASTEAFACLGVRVPENLRHTALGDARATAELLTRLVGLVVPAGIATAMGAAA
jgi:DNA polymerase-3 subunit epsilon